MNIIIGICGLKSSGKDTLAFALLNCFSLELWPIAKRIGFADNLKKEVAEYLEVDVAWIEKRKRLPEIRQLLQRWGTEYRRAEDINYWIKQLDEQISQYRGRYKNLKTNTIVEGQLKYKELVEEAKQQATNSVFVIPDLRFLNEAEYIREQGGLIFRIERTGQHPYTDKHSSENDFQKIRVDHVVHNDQTKLKLEKEAFWLYETIIKNHYGLK